MFQTITLSFEDKNKINSIYNDLWSKCMHVQTSENVPTNTVLSVLPDRSAFSGLLIIGHVVQFISPHSSMERDLHSGLDII